MHRTDVYRWLARCRHGPACNALFCRGVFVFSGVSENALPKAAPRRRFRSLQRDLLLRLIAVFVLVAIAIGATTAWIAVRQYTRSLETEARLAATALVSMQSAISDPAVLQEFVRGFSREDQLKLVVVVRGTPSVVIASTRSDWIGKPVTALPVVAVGEDLLEVAQKRVGLTRMHSDRSEFDCTLPFGVDGAAMIHIEAGGLGRQALAATLQVGGISLCGFVVFGIFSASLLRRRVVGRIAAIARGISGDFAVHRGFPLDHGPFDEITLLGETIHAAHRKVGQSFEELERLALVARKTTNAVLITDIERRVVWVNEGFTRITGYTLDEVRGRVPGSILQCGKTDRSAIATMRAAMNDHQGCRVELLNVAKDGREYWLDIEIQPMRDSGGVVTGFMAIESDITAAVRAREEIAASERRQHMIVAGADLGTWDWNVETGEVHFNERWCTMLGYSPNEIEPHIRSWERLLHPDDVVRVRSALEDYFAGRTDLYRCEHRLRHKDGSVVWVIDSGKTYERCSEGRPRRMAGIHLDITERRRADERFELVVKGSSAGIWDWNVLTGEDYLSPRWKELLGYRDDELTNHFDSWVKLIHPEDSARALAALEAHLERKVPYAIDFRLRHKSGDFRWFHASGQAVWNTSGCAVRMAGSLEDIHDRRVLEGARQRLAAIVESSEDAIFGLAKDGVIHTSNDAALRMFGPTVRSTAHGSERDFVPEPERALESAALARMTDGARGEQYESRRIRADGTWIEVSVALSPIRDEEGFVVGAAKIVRDISDRREKRELEKLNVLLAGQNRKLEEMTERAHRFVDDVSHEFRTPLTVIKEFSSIIADGLGGPVSAQQSEWLQIIDVAAVDLNQMVEDFLDSSKLRMGRLRVDRRPCAVDSIVAGVRRMVARKAASRAIQVVERIEPGLPQVFVDEEKVRRIVMNLITNAMKFSPDGGTVVLEVRSCVEGDVKFSVIDEGPGLSPADMGRLFARFRQLPNALSPSVKGFGLGLNIARQLVWLNLGTISVASEQGKGATFSFTLPSMDMELVANRFFERLAEREEQPTAVGMLRVVPALGTSRDDVRRLVVASTRPADIVVEASDGLSLVVFGPTSSVETWSLRLAEGIRDQRVSVEREPAVRVVGSWAYPDDGAVARAAICANGILEKIYVA